MGKIIKTASRDIKHFKESFFHYNLNQNLDSVVSNEYYNNLLIKKTLEIFRAYDNNTNPVKNLYIFEETFNRSLNENNYSEYEKSVYDYRYTEDLIHHEKLDWNFKYDGTNIIRFDIL